MTRLEEIIHSKSNLTIKNASNIKIEVLCTLAELAREKNVQLTLHVAELTEEVIDIVKHGGRNVTIVI